jgi:hypothetical protein
MSEVEVEFLCPCCLQYVKGKVVQEWGGYFTSCPCCGPTRGRFPVSINVETKGAFEAIQLERTRQLWREYCEFDGVGYLLKREHWPTALQHVGRHNWWCGAREDRPGFAFLVTVIPIPMKRRPPEPFWGSHFLSVGSFKEVEDIVNPEKISRLYAVENEKEAEFIRRALTHGKW